MSEKGRNPRLGRVKKQVATVHRDYEKALAKLGIKLGEGVGPKHPKYAQAEAASQTYLQELNKIYEEILDRYRRALEKLGLQESFYLVNNDPRWEAVNKAWDTYKEERDVLPRFQRPSSEDAIE